MARIFQKVLVTSLATSTSARLKKDTLILLLKTFSVTLWNAPWHAGPCSPGPWSCPSWSTRRRTSQPCIHQCPDGRSKRLRCCAQPGGALGDASPPDDHVPLRVAMEKPGFRPHEEAHFQGWLAKHLVFSSALDRFHQQVAQTTPFQALGKFKTFVPKAQQEARRTLLRNPPTSEWREAIGCCHR